MVRRMDPRLHDRDHEVALSQIGGTRPGRKARTFSAFCLLFALACNGITGPSGPPYLAVVATIVAPTPAAAGVQYRYHVRQITLSEDTSVAPIDTVIKLKPYDTLIVSLQPATYVVDIGGLPPQCKSREGQQIVPIAPNTNTTLVRYFVVCTPELLMSVRADGPRDSEYVYHLVDAAGHEQTGLVRSRDTLEFEGLPPGRTTVDLGGVAPNCIVSSDGGSRQSVVIDSAGGAHLDFAVWCSDLAHSPTLASVHWSYVNGVAGLVFTGIDHDRDIDRYYWDITDCRRNSILGGKRLIGGLYAGRTLNRDTITVLGAFETGLTDADLAGRCGVIWLFDRAGNSSFISEQELRKSQRAPTAAVFNAYYVATSAVRVDLAADDPDHDFLGTFVVYHLRDGSFGPPNGVPDVAFLHNLVGDLGSLVPDFPMGGVYTYEKFYAVVVYLLDAQGNVTRLEDDDLFY